MKRLDSRAFTVRALVAVAILGGASAAHALTLDNIIHMSDAGGLWNNTSPSNWAIWVSTNSDPNSANPRPFLNEPPAAPNGPLNSPIPFPENGTFTYTLYKNTYGSVDQSTEFQFTHRAASGSITIAPNTPYLATADPVPATPGQSLTLEDVTISINSFGWYHENVFGKDFVGPNQNLGANGQNDHIAVMTFTVVPEPGSAALLALTGAAALLRHRRG